MLRNHLHRRVAVEDLLAGEHVVADAAERVEVSASIDGVAHHHFRGHVAGRADNEPGLSRQRLIQAAIGDRFHQAEVEDLDEVVYQAEPSDMDVRRLDVAMHETANVCLVQ